MIKIINWRFIIFFSFILLLAFFAIPAAISLLFPKQELSLKNNNPFNTDLENKIFCDEIDTNLRKPNIDIDGSKPLDIRENLQRIGGTGGYYKGQTPHLADDVLKLAKKYAHALGNCIYGAQIDTNELETYEFKLIDLVTYNLFLEQLQDNKNSLFYTEMDIVVSPRKYFVFPAEIEVDEFERPITFEKLKLYGEDSTNSSNIDSDFNFILDKINKICMNPETIKDENIEAIIKVINDPEAINDKNIKAVIEAINDKNVFEISYHNPTAYPGITLKGNNIFLEFECIVNDEEHWRDKNLDCKVVGYDVVGRDNVDDIFVVEFKIPTLITEVLNTQDYESYDPPCE